MVNNGRKKEKVTGPDTMRMAVVFILVVLLGLACIFQTFRLAIFERGISTGNSAECIDTTDSTYVPSERDENCKCFVMANPLRPTRGEIYDDKGRLLVGNYTAFEISFDGKAFAKVYGNESLYAKAEVDEMLKQLAGDFDSQFHTRYPKYDAKHYYELFKKAYTKQKYVTVFSVKEWSEKTWITGVDTAFVRHLPYLQKKLVNKKTNEIKKKKWCGYINFVSSPVRINPYGEMARRTLGIYSEGLKFGMEEAMNETLAGEEGSKKYLKLNNTVVPLNKRVEPVNGYNIHSTINLEFQNAVHNELMQQLIKLNAEWGCVIVMETKTGEIKAITNLRRESKDTPVYAESMEYALNAKVEPGSTFKLVSLMSYFEKGMPENKGDFPIYAHTFEYRDKSGRTHRKPKVDSKVHGESTGTPNKIFQISSNIGIASMIFEAYGDRGFANYRKQLKKFGFFDTIPTQMGPLLPATIRNDGRFDNYYATCFGAGFNVPVLRTLMFYNAVANGGKMMKPMFVKCISNEFDTIQTFEPEVVMDSIASPRTLRLARAYLDSVVWGRYGTGRHYKDSTCPFAGKTGTRDIWDMETNSYNYDRNAVSFCGYFPNDKPQYTAIVYIYDVPQHSEVAVEVFGKIARSIKNSQNYSAMRSIRDYEVQPLKTAGYVNRKFFNPLLHKLGYDTVVTDGKVPYLALVSGNRKEPVKVVTRQVNKQNGVPNVMGLLASDAVSEVMRAGYKVSVHGLGVVKRQEYDASVRVVRLYLE